MYCVRCDRWEYDQIAVECGICTRCEGPLHEPPDDDDYSQAKDAQAVAKEGGDE